jgi:beta-glucosidase
MIAQYADGQHVFYLDLSEKFLDQKGHLSTDVLPDLIHPNRRGYKVWAGAMEEVIAKLYDRNQVEGQFFNSSRGKEQWLVK